MIIMSLRVFEKQSPVYEEIAHLHCNTPFGQAVRRKCRNVRSQRRDTGFIGI